jgi:hypothetical protein
MHPMADAEDFQVQASGEVSGPTRESVERLRRAAEESGDDRDQQAYERARIALAAQEKGE